MRGISPATTNFVREMKMRILIMLMFMLPAVFVQGDQQSVDQTKAEKKCCLEGDCPVASAQYCACGNCKDGCDCCQSESCNCEGCTCEGCVSTDKESKGHAALINVKKLKKADCCQSGRCALANTQCGCDKCEANCTCCSKQKCECKTCSCTKCKDSTVGAHAASTLTCGCGSCEAGCGCCTGDECTCKGCTCSGCVSGKKMHVVLVSKTSGACCKIGGACAHGHHGHECKCDAAESQLIPDPPVLK